MMEVKNDLRWKQRFQNLENARGQLYDLFAAYQQNKFDKRLQSQLIYSFEFSFKLGWKTVKDYLIYQGVRNINFPREVIKKGFKYHVILDGQAWIDIIEDQALIEHTENAELAGQAVSRISERYMAALDQVYEYFKLKNREIMQFGLPEGMLQLFCKVFKEYPEIDAVKIYGSRAFGNCEHTSDIDLAFYTDSKKPLSDKLQQELDALPTPYIFDLTNYNKIAHKPLKDNIDKVGKTIYENSECCT